MNVILLVNWGCTESAELIWTDLLRPAADVVRMWLIQFVRVRLWKKQCCHVCPNQLDFVLYYVDTVITHLQVNSKHSIYMNNFNIASPRAVVW